MPDVRAWLVWALAVLGVASATRNPLYALLLLLVVVLSEVVHAPRGERRAGQATLRFTAVVVPLAALFNLLTVHLGETVLLRLPQGIPLVGGPLTLEALLFGVTNGLVLAAIFGGFAVFNGVTPARDLIRLTPRAFHAAGVVLSIALTFLPQTSRSLERIREAQAVRGHRVRGVRDWLPLVVPLLVSGLERSMSLAEAMVARGYGATTGRARSLRLQLLLASGMLALLAGWLAYLLLPLPWGGIGLALAAVGVALLLVVLRMAGSAVAHTDYRPLRWAARDSLVALGCGVALAVVFLPLPGIDRTSLSYVPYPRLTLPAFDPWIGIGLLGLLVPVGLGWGAGREADT
jgi:energy-coupling factor transport system permease protein